VAALLSISLSILGSGMLDVSVLDEPVQEL
jgi:hypothetical protein